MHTQIASNSLDDLVEFMRTWLGEEIRIERDVSIREIRATSSFVNFLFNGGGARFTLENWGVQCGAERRKCEALICPKIN